MESKEIIILIYLIGIPFGYIFMRAYRKHMAKKIIDNDDPSWADVIVTLLLSSCSWFAVIVALLSFILDHISNIKIKPPKWL